MESFYEIKDFDEKIIGSTKFYHLILDSFPVNDGHILIISKDNKKEFFDLTREEKADLNNAINIAKEIIEQNHSPDGYNIGMNCGEYAGQTVFHFHCHLIPRYKGDMDDPRGGVRHCVAGKGYY